MTIISMNKEADRITFRMFGKIHHIFNVNKTLGLIQHFVHGEQDYELPWYCREFEVKRAIKKYLLK